MGDNGGMSDPALAPRNAFVGVLIVWAVAVVASIGVGVFVSSEWRVPWLIVAFGGIVLLSFATQLWYGRTQGFILRVGGSTIGALLLMGVISIGFGLAALVT
ncbi:hypothetical protein SRABI44_00755 [Microbacterium foliorum]|uniref:Uncharacterized protein n=2 Tax=Microbacterium foliorum TaxID=104336 RepID=A0A0F0KP02_9MICO|nr:hypothetical protein RN50_01941 [Microbacterium foliorum]CAH0152665.1 hypothetical protein SRABI44_00755 [Microbacterium foliorum]CAH0192524.1 hypothetical protein SRABI03_01775 [Microbacterium foliorum]